MKLNIFGILRGEIAGDFQGRCGAASVKIRAQKIEARFGGGRDDALEVGNGFGGKVFREQNQTEIVVSFGVGRLGAKNRAKFFFGESGILLGEVKITEIHSGASGSGIEFKGVLEGVECVDKIFLAGEDDAEQVVAFNAFGILSELCLDFLFGFFQSALLEE